MKNQIIIVGAGASGLLSAILIKKEMPDCNVVVIEKEKKIAKKLLASGSGKCNLSNKDLNANYYNNPGFVKDKLAKFDFEKLSEVFLSLGLLLKTDKENRAYPYSENSKTVLEVLKYNIEKYKIKIILDTKIEKIEKKDKFYLYSKDKTFESDFLILAMGGQAMVANFNGYSILNTLGHKINNLSPSLVGLITYEDTSSLKGIRIKANVRVKEKEELGEVQFRENGVSGIVVMNLSGLVDKGDVLFLDLMPEYNSDEVKALFSANDNLKVLEGIFLKPLANYIYSKGKALDDVVKKIKNLEFKIKTKDSFMNAQVTRGGVDLSNIGNNFESNKIADLYILGESLDIDGVCGGYNLHFAWLSAYFASVDLIKKQKK